MGKRIHPRIFAGFLMVTLFVCSTHCNEEDSIPKTTMRWKFAALDLPEVDQVCLVFRSHVNPYYFTMNLFVDGTLALRIPQSYSYIYEYAWTHACIYEEAIEIESNKFKIPVKYHQKKGRSLLVTSKDSMEWQMFTLPVPQSMVQTTSRGNSTTFSLPNEDTILIAFQPKMGNESTFDIKYTVGGETYDRMYSGTPKRKWTFVKILKALLDIPGVFDSDLPKRYQTLGSRKVTVSSPQEIQWQMLVFPLPFRKSKVTDPSALFNWLTILMASICTITIISMTVLICCWKQQYKLVNSKPKNTTDSNLPNSEIRSRSIPMRELPPTPTTDSQNQIGNVGFSSRDGHFRGCIPLRTIDEEDHIYGHPDDFMPRHHMLDTDGYVNPNKDEHEFPNNW